MDKKWNWPPAVADYLRRFVMEMRSPAFLLTDAGGRVVSQGGDLSRYGLGRLRVGDIASEQAYFLEGLLPINGEASVLCRVETSAGVFADIHLFRVEESDCVLLLDASVEVAERTQIEQAFRETEERLRQAEKMEALGRLAGGVAHDFNNLLTVILGYSELLADMAPDSESGAAAREIALAAEKATAMTQQLLSFSRRQGRHAEVLDLNSVISGVEQLLQRLIGEDIALHAVLDGGVGPVEADRAQMEQVLVNLAANARDAMPCGGSLEIRTANATVDDAFVCDHPGTRLRQGSYARMAVTDTGCGMDAETRARAFEPFFTSKPVGQGTGLGLSIVYGIVTQAGGDVMLTSAVGEGTRVEVLLPVAQKPAAMEAIAKGKAPARGNEIVLVVEDEDSVRNLIRAVLTDLGYTVLGCSEPLAAIALCERLKEKIDLLVTDVILPHMDGVKLAGLITMNRPEMRVLYLSGYAPESFSERRLELAGNAFLGKPFTPATLADTIRAALDGQKTCSTKPA